MSRYLLKRLLLLIPTLFLICVIIFVLMRIAPGNAESTLIQEYQQLGIPITEEEAAEILGLNTPPLQQFADWIWGLLHGDMGDCLFQTATVWSIIKTGLPVSIELGLISMILQMLIAIPVGILCAAKLDSATDNVIRAVSVVIGSMPIFWISTMILVYPAIWWKFSVPIKYVPFFTSPVDNLAMFLVPALVSAITGAGNQVRGVRTMVLEVVKQDYVRTAYAKGTKTPRVMFRHAFRNALIPIVTMFGGAVSGIVGGSVVLENIFNLPGIGHQLVSSLDNRDYPLAQGITVIFALCVLAINIVVDIAYKWCDPRVSLE